MSKVADCKKDSDVPEEVPHRPVKVLDHGFVRLVEVMGGDRGVVQAARVSFGLGLKGPEADRKLVRYLLTNHHLSPFEHSLFKLHVKLPIFVARQWFRHRIAGYEFRDAEEGIVFDGGGVVDASGSSINEFSARYAEMADEFYIPEVWRIPDPANKQGSLPAPDRDNAGFSEALSAHCAASFKLYQGALDRGIAKELARLFFPVNLYTQFYWTVNARALMNFISLRSDIHAQWEIRQYSDAIWPIFVREMPWTALAFFDTLPGPVDKKYAGLHAKSFEEIMAHGS